MRTLYFEQITDSRFDTDCEKLLENRINMLRSELNKLDSVCCKCYEIRRIDFESNYQYRCKCYVTKWTRKTTWNDIYKIVNNIHATKYNFINL